MDRLYGGIEAGGTKFLCVVGHDPQRILAQVRIETTNPDETLQRVAQFFLPFTAAGRIRTLGLGSFGPIDLDPASETYGCITSTPKPGWQNTPIVRMLGDALRVSVAVDTDVNVAALGEATWGASRGSDPSLYLTIGTGIGGGFMQAGKALRGLSHPEMGHIRIPHDRKVDPFPGNCRFHGDCFEGLANGPAIRERCGRNPETLPDDEPFWRVEANYIAAALCIYILILSPARIILGGGIMQRAFLFPAIRQNVLGCLNGYLQCAAILADIDAYIIPPVLGSRSGVLGALALAQREETANSG